MSSKHHNRSLRISTRRNPKNRAIYNSQRLHSHNPIIRIHHFPRHTSAMVVPYRAHTLPAKFPQHQSIFISILRISRPHEPEFLPPEPIPEFEPLHRLAP
ncbi:hypothetical protein IC582_002631 [Cucumis melo]